MFQGLFFGPVYEGQCDSWYTNMVLLGKEISVVKGDRIVLKTEANLTNFQMEQHMVSLVHGCWLSCSSYTIVVAAGSNVCCIGTLKVVMFPVFLSHLLLNTGCFFYFLLGCLFEIY